MNIDVAIIVAAITGIAGVLGTWLTMRAQMRSAEAVLIAGYSKLVNDLRTEIDRLNVKQAAIEKQVAELQGIVKERDLFIERLTFAFGNALNVMAKANGGGN